ncbi:MAG: 50S ribosomal protein L15 [Opitutaceae bacterium]|nr:50S ribosomal protein L15 [Opitutaceae bacterium]|tara:strand:+ start:3351 stop:3797 length:447 start_codon:yes stop_codon:yes gene_type:complete
MRLHNLSNTPGAVHRKKRVGNGESSGWGKTCGKGHKGQKSRSGGGIPIGFEGGQMPLYRKLPHRGFSNVQFATNYEVVNVGDLAKLGDETNATPDNMVKAGLLRADSKRVKILGTGDVEKAFKVSAHKFSASARKKIEKAGGEVIELS